MLQKIFDEIISDYYFIDNETLLMYRRGHNKFLPIKWQIGKYGLSVPLQIYRDETSGRNRTRNTGFSYIVGKYIFNIQEPFILEYDINNLNINNIKIKYLSDISTNWKPVIMNDNFLISENGLLYNKKYCIIQEPNIDISGYRFFCINGRRINRSHLVWKTFNNTFEIPEGYVIDHINNIVYDDKIENLQCITNRENIIKEIHRDLPYGIKKIKNIYKVYIGYKINKKIYHNVYLGSFKNVEEAVTCREKALVLINKGIDPIKYGENEHIRYKFSTDTWYFKIPQIKGVDKLYDGYKTYEQAEIAFNKYRILDTSLETDEERIVRKGYFSFQTAITTFKVNKGKYANDIFIKAYQYYKKCKETNNVNEFIEKLPLIKKQIRDENKKIKENLKNKEKEQKLEAKRRYQERRNIEKQEKQKTIEEARLNFVCKSNYTTDKKGYYIMKIPYRDGKWYYLHSFLCLDIVKEIDNIMNEYKYSDDFIEKFKDFKENELPKYVERDTAYKAEKENTIKGKKGYKWFNPRNCWRVVKRINNKEYSLGYFKDERCCKMILDEAVNAIKLGVFNEWYNHIEDHRFRIKKLFNDESLPENKTYEANSTVFQKGLCVCQYKNDKLIGNYKTISDASRQFNSNSASKSIGECCRGIKKSYMGYKWKIETVS